MRIDGGCARCNFLDNKLVSSVAGGVVQVCLGCDEVCGAAFSWSKVLLGDDGCAGCGIVFPRSELVRSVYGCVVSCCADVCGAAFSWSMFLLENICCAG